MSGVNDDLNGEEPVRFQTSDGEWCSVVHSLAKWKRWMLWKLRDDGVSGIWCDMRGIRKCEDADVICTSPMHSYQVEQFDWEKVNPSEKRNIEFLKGDCA
ncbi:aspartate-ammonia ligase [Enterocytozoon bieneusi H348]|nr:aspartate-ammonia ligase [Enterocytozoon bieneusi H348]|eukprot:XP_002652399.1 aspartate-ammonia ligase [Enterocytozoon bieneusi H348]